MAFDRNNPVDVLALKNELTIDPIGMGYAAQTNTQKLLSLLNDPANNVGGDTIAQDLSPETLMGVLDVSEYNNDNQVGQGERDLIKLIFDLGIHQGVSIEQYRAKIKSLFPTNGPTNTAIDALMRDLSRAEVLFGAGTVITKEDYYAARDS